MREFGLKLCLFLFLTALLSGRTNTLGTLVGAATGTILLWPIYRKVLPTAALRTRRSLSAERDPMEAGAD
jgi:hypothetical protein